MKTTKCNCDKGWKQKQLNYQIGRSYCTITPQDNKSGEIWGVVLQHLARRDGRLYRHKCIMLFISTEISHCTVYHIKKSICTCKKYEIWRK